jgi:hypothetical protein
VAGRFTGPQGTHFRVYVHIERGYVYVHGTASGGAVDRRVRYAELEVIANEDQPTNFMLRLLGIHPPAECSVTVRLRACLREPSCCLLRMPFRAIAYPRAEQELRVQCASICGAGVRAARSGHASVAAILQQFVAEKEARHGRR